MFKKLQAKWKVNGAQLFVIIIIFALGGSLCGYAGRKLLGLANIELRWLWILAYVLLITLLWPICVLLISIPFGQFGFFKRYVGKIGRRMFGGKVVRGTTNQGGGGRIAIFASGAGSNAKKIIEYFKDKNATVSLIICNKPGAGVLAIAEANHIPVLLIDKTSFYSETSCVQQLTDEKIDLLVLAGFLWKLPPVLIKAFPGKIINIHPALLPKYGGQGMYGARVHDAVIASADKESGISIHYVDDIYDHGEIIFQAKCKVDENETADSLAEKIHALEHEHYPTVVEQVLKKL